MDDLKFKKGDYVRIGTVYNIGEVFYNKVGKIIHIPGEVHDEHTLRFYHVKFRRQDISQIYDETFPFNGKELILMTEDEVLAWRI